VPAGPAPVAAPPAAIATKWQTQVALAPAQTVSSPLPSPETLKDDRVASQGVNVRSAASKDALKLFALAPDSSVRTAETVSGWVHIYADAGDGWVYSSLLASRAPADGATNAQASGGSSLVGQRVRLGSATRVYESPNGSPVYILDAGERVQVADSSGDWARIVTDTDESGWIRVR
jgi:SH3-like domain-containing protein